YLPAFPTRRSSDLPRVFDLGFQKNCCQPFICRYSFDTMHFRKKSRFLFCCDPPLLNFHTLHLLSGRAEGLGLARSPGSIPGPEWDKAPSGGLGTPSPPYIPRNLKGGLGHQPFCRVGGGGPLKVPCGSPLRGPRPPPRSELLGHGAALSF